MWGTNSISQRFQSNNKLSFENGRGNLIQNQTNINNNNNPNDLNQLYQTPIKQFENIQNNTNNNSNITPFRFDFNYYFGNLWSAGQIPNNQLIEQNINLSPTQINKENLFFLKKSIEKSYRLSPISQLKNNSSSQNNSNNSNNSIRKYNNNMIVLNPNNDNVENNIKINEINDINKSSNLNINELSKKNLSELFNNAKNEEFLYDAPNGNKDINHINNSQRNIINNTIDLKNEIRKKNCNLQISHQFIFSSPRITKKPKKIFECSGSTIATNSSIKSSNKKRRFRKNNEQLSLLKKFYNEHKYWSKTQIKEISQNIGLKENKVYKWLWDQRNKEMKATKFVVKKGNSS